MSESRIFSDYDNLMMVTVILGCALLVMILMKVDYLWVSPAKPGSQSGPGPKPELVFLPERPGLRTFWRVMQAATFSGFFYLFFMMPCAVEKCGPDNVAERRPGLVLAMCLVFALVIPRFLLFLWDLVSYVRELFE
jgi:hypothetical protein